MIHLTHVAGGPLAHFKTKRPRTMRFTCVRALLRLRVRVYVQRQREVLRRVMLCTRLTPFRTKPLPESFTSTLRRSFKLNFQFKIILFQWK